VRKREGGREGGREEEVSLSSSSSSSSKGVKGLVGAATIMAASVTSSEMMQG